MDKIGAILLTLETCTGTLQADSASMRGGEEAHRGTLQADRYARHLWRNTEACDAVASESTCSLFFHSSCCSHLAWRLVVLVIVVLWRYFWKWDLYFSIHDFCNSSTYCAVVTASFFFFCAHLIYMDRAASTVLKISRQITWSARVSWPMIY